MTFTAEPSVASRVLSHHEEIPMPEKTLNDLFLAQLKDIYFAEKKIFRTLPKMVKAANDAELKKARAKSSASSRCSR
jgi:hypothetical protein